MSWPTSRERAWSKRQSSKLRAVPLYGAALVNACKQALSPFSNDGGDGGVRTPKRSGLPRGATNTPKVPGAWVNAFKQALSPFLYDGGDGGIRTLGTGFTSTTV